MEPDFATLFAPKAIAPQAAGPEPDFASVFAPKARPATPHPPIYDENNKPIDQTALYAQKPPELSTSQKIYDAFTKVNEHPFYALGESVGKLSGAKSPESYGRNTEALVNSLGPLGQEFQPLTDIRRAPSEYPGATPKVAPITEVPATSALKDMQQSMYKEAKDANVKYSSVGYARAVKDAVMAAKKEGFDADLHPDSARVLKRLVSEIPKEMKPSALSPMTGVKPTQPYKEFSFEDIDTLRKVVGEARKGTDPNKAKDRRMANIINDKLDQWFENPNPSDVVSGDPQVVARASGAARKLTVRLKKAEILDEAHQRALDKVGANYTNAGLQTALRQEFKSIRGRKDFKHRWDRAEQSAIKAIVRGGGAGISGENILRYLGKFSPTSPLSAIITMTLGGGPAGGLPLMATGYMAARASAKMGQKKVDTLNALVRRGYAGDTSLGNP